MEITPLILTLLFDTESFERFDRERRLYFPPERNHIPAHATLFHKLPGEEERSILDDLRTAASRAGPFDVDVVGMRFLGYGSAYNLRSPELESLRKGLADTWAEWLTPQDRQRFAPHVTIQNKAPAQEAKALFARLDASFTPFQVQAVGLALWRYRGGPWEQAARIPFET